jgi:hypothetical protein
LLPAQVLELGKLQALLTAARLFGLCGEHARIPMLAELQMLDFEWLELKQL